MACLRLFTIPPLPPLPERRVPRFLRRMALATVWLAPRLYLRPLDFLRALALRFPGMLFFSHYLEAEDSQQVVRPEACVLFGNAKRDALG